MPRRGVERRRSPGRLPAHIGGTTAEIVVPLVLLFSPWPWLTWLAIISIWMLHTFIISTIPLAVPLERNVFFMFSAGFLFGNFSAGDGYGVLDMTPWLLIPVLTVALGPIIYGAFKPEHVSFLIGMKQYAGNRASTTWSFSDSEKEDRLNERIVTAADNQIDQLEPLFGREISEIFMEKAIAFRMMRPMDRAHITLHMRHNEDMDRRVLREGGFMSNTLTGWTSATGTATTSDSSKRCRSAATSNRVSSWWCSPSRSPCSTRRCSIA